MRKRLLIIVLVALLAGLGFVLTQIVSTYDAALSRLVNIKTKTDQPKNYQKTPTNEGLLFGSHFTWIRQADGSGAVIDRKTGTVLSSWISEYPPFLEENISLQQTPESPGKFAVTRVSDWEHHWEQQEYYDGDTGAFLGATLWDDIGGIRIWTNPGKKPELEFSLERKNCIPVEGPPEESTDRCSIPGLKVNGNMVQFKQTKSLICQTSAMDGGCYFDPDLGRPATRDGRTVSFALPWGTPVEINLEHPLIGIHSKDFAKEYPFQ